ncbi:Uncharacterized protein PBTT_05928 [Plasmodiophora brassicae]|uniref:Uncharacterized protein n=1 Tax=Plasmodiophora brassicae TaxID=37360 RepID=A0A0G4J352_PLABS|nr:hypothetical protein PBRA_002217 [Plasmodiophora brassicae]SPQ98812.1 unnamed protein product [Plasmodiophora brassicae]
MLRAVVGTRRALSSMAALPATLQGRFLMNNPGKRVLRVRDGEGATWYTADRAPDGQSIIVGVGGTSLNELYDKKERLILFVSDYIGGKVGLRGLTRVDLEPNEIVIDSSRPPLTKAQIQQLVLEYVRHLELVANVQWCSAFPVPQQSVHRCFGRPVLVFDDFVRWSERDRDTANKLLVRIMLNDEVTAEADGVVALTPSDFHYGRLPPSSALFFGSLVMSETPVLLKSNKTDLFRIKDTRKFQNLFRHKITEWVTRSPVGHIFDSPIELDGAAWAGYGPEFSDEFDTGDSLTWL